jgi:hypothetical protein
MSKKHFVITTTEPYYPGARTTVTYNGQPLEGVYSIAFQVFAHDHNTVTLTFQDATVEFIVLPKPNLDKD